MKKIDDQLYAIWVLASNDQQRIVSYPNLYYRLTENASFEGITSLDDITKEERYKQLVKVVNGRRELFRPGAPDTELQEWKDKLKQDKKDQSDGYPAWLKEIQNGKVQDNIIDNLEKSHVFRSQFRTGGKKDPSDKETLQWGLDYMDSLREAEAAPGKAWREQLAILVSLVVALISLLVSLFTVGYSEYVAIRTKHEELANARQLKREELDSAKQLKTLEVYSPREVDYFAFMDALDKAYDDAISKSQDKWTASLANLDARLRLFEAYFEKKSAAESLRSTYKDFVDLGNALLSRKAEEDKMRSRFDQLKGNFAVELAELWRGH